MEQRQLGDGGGRDDHPRQAQVAGKVHEGADEERGPEADEHEEEQQARGRGKPFVRDPLPGDRRGHDQLQRAVFLRASDRGGAEADRVHEQQDRKRRGEEACLQVARRR